MMLRSNRTATIVVTSILCLICLGAATFGGQSNTSVVINEFLASNSGDTYNDPQGEPADWIELYNPSATAVDVGGMYMTDDLLTPTKWQVPTGKTSETTIEPQGYLVIWADKDVTDSGLHANFSLSAAGEELGLFGKDGVTLIDSVEFGQQMTDVSYGRVPDGNDAWYPMTFPTPGSENFRLYEGIVKKPRLSVEHGFYNQEFTVTITCETQGAMIYYTIDGTAPYVADAVRPSTTATVYNGPVRITRTTCLRAVGVKTGWYASAVATRTYIFLADVVKQSPTGASPGRGWPTGNVNGQTLDYGMDPDVVNDARYKNVMSDALLAIPTISLVTDPANLFDAQKGIYVHASMQGEDWERPVSAELINPDGTEGFQIDAGLRIRGGYSRSGGNPKHAFRLFFRTEYGQSTLKYPLFGDEGVDEFDTIDLRTGQNYSWSFEGGSSPRDTFVREVFSRDTQRDMGRPYTRSRYYHLYVDGQYWGLFQTQERAEASYAESYFGPAKEDYDVVKSRAGNGGYDIEATDGALDAWRRLWDASNAGFNDDATYYRVQGLNPDGTPNPTYEKLLDVDNLIDYMLCTYYVGDPDGPVSAWALVCNNFYGIYNRVHPEGFKFFRHDAEHSLYDLNESRLFAASTVAVGRTFNYSNPLWMHTHLILHPEYRTRFADRVYKHFFNSGVLTPQVCTDRFMARADQIDMAIIAESARWGDSKVSKPRTKDDDWLPDINGMVKNYFPQRTTVVLNQFKSQGWYPSIDPPTLTPLGGHVTAGSAVQMQSSRDIYYTVDGTDPRPPEKGGAVAAGQAIVPENAAKRVLVPTAEISDAWKGGSAFDDSSWKVSTGGPGGVGYERSSGYQNLISLDVVSQMYNINTSCYIRIPFTLSTDLSKFSSLVLNVRYDDGFIAYLNGVEVQHAQFTGAPKWNSMAGANIEADAPESFNIIEHLNLLQQGQNILAIHGLNVSRTSSDFLIMASLTAGEDTPAQGGGIAPTAVKYVSPVTLSKSTQVKARTRSGNLWSALNEAVFAVGPVAQNLRISEIMYHPAQTGNPNDPNTEFIELTNIGAAAINLNLVSFSNGVEFTFPSYDLAAGRYCLVVKDKTAFQAKYGSGLPVVGQYSGSLNNAGEQIELLDAAGAVIHSFLFADNWFDITDGLGFSLTVKDPKTADPNGYGDKSLWRPSAKTGGSPGTDDSGQVPALGAVVINELLSNPAAGDCDWVELRNTTNQAVNIAGWYLSDDANDLTKYKIAAGTSIAANGYTVFYENRHFGSKSDPGSKKPFGLSSNGETVYLQSGSAGVLTGYSQQEKFDASEVGVTLGRYEKSTGSYNFVALSKATPGAANAAPQIGPVVINEIMYHSDAPVDAEYVELLNISGSPVTLYDADQQTPWRFTDDPDKPSIELLFPTNPPLTLAAGEYLLLVKGLTQFSAKYAPPAGVKILAWTMGNLSNDGQKIQLSKPGSAEDDGTRHWIRVDRVVYTDGSHPQDFAGGMDPWPTKADGQGSSLSRATPSAYGNDADNWHAATASPGKANN
jgi:hypothetical protein